MGSAPRGKTRSGDVVRRRQPEGLNCRDRAPDNAFGMWCSGMASANRWDVAEGICAPGFLGSGAMTSACEAPLRFDGLSLLDERRFPQKPFLGSEHGERPT